MAYGAHYVTNIYCLPLFVNQSSMENISSIGMTSPPSIVTVPGGGRDDFHRACDRMVLATVFALARHEKPDADLRMLIQPGCDFDEPTIEFCDLLLVQFNMLPDFPFRQSRRCAGC